MRLTTIENLHFKSSYRAVKLTVLLASAMVTSTQYSHVLNIALAFCFQISQTVSTKNLGTRTRLRGNPIQQNKPRLLH